MATSDDPTAVQKLLSFLWRNKLWWLMPAVSVLIVFALLMYLARSNASSPFVYTLF
jgi:hypothetical protein